MANKGIVRLDKVRAVYNGHIESVVHTAELENGMVVMVGDLKDGERELRKVEAPKTGDVGVHLVASTEINKSEYVKTDNALENFSIPAGTAARAYRLEAGDIFSVTKVTGNMQKGKYVKAEALTLEVAEIKPATGFAGKIIDVETLGTTTVVGQAGSVARINKYAVIEVLNN